MAIPRLSASTTAVLVVDVQEKLLPHMHNAAEVTQQVGRLLAGAQVLDLPVLVTEQYPKGLGRTVPAVEALLDRAELRQEKMLFSACLPPVRQALDRLGRRVVLVAGIEAHVCILQTCLDLLEAGVTTALVSDAIGSRRAADQTAAVQRLVQAGVVPTTVESALLEMVREAGTPQFKAMLPVIK